MRQVLKIAAIGLVAALFSSHAKAAVVDGSVTYYTMTSDGKDFGNTAFCCGAHYSNEAVLGSLGINGLPVYNPTYGGPALQDLLNGQINWWQGSGTSTTTFATNSSGLYDQTLFPPNGTGSNDANGFQTAIFKTTNLAANTTYTLTYTADDDVFFAINGAIFSEDGGVHAAGQFTTTSFNTGVGGQLEIFFADRYQVDSELDFTVTAVPEASTWAMMVLGFLGVGFLAYRRKGNGIAFRIA
jgi:hypothetical protein